jgi:hypothetical protein
MSLDSPDPVRRPAPRRNGSRLAALSGALLLLSAVSLEAQTTRPGATTTLAADSVCYVPDRPLGDSTPGSQPQVWTDSAGINKPGGPTTCRKITAMQADSICNTASADSSTYLHGDRSAALRKPEFCNNQRMGAGVGNDTTRWPARPDSTKPRKP